MDSPSACLGPAVRWRGGADARAAPRRPLCGGFGLRAEWRAQGAFRGPAGRPAAVWMEPSPRGNRAGGELRDGAEVIRKGLSHRRGEERKCYRTHVLQRSATEMGKGTRYKIQPSLLKRACAALDGGLSG